MADEYRFDDIYQLSHQNGQIPFVLDRDIEKYRPIEESDFSLTNKAGEANIDAFNRLRVSNPETLFESSHRYSANDLWAELSTGPGSSGVFNPDQGLIDINVDDSAGSEVIRETKRIFVYQPGKSLLVMSTFAMSPAKTGLRQRVGYFGEKNGFYVQQNNSQVSFVRRSSVSGSLNEFVVSQENWNTDKLNGTGKSGITLDISKAQILWMDFEWLGTGTVRMGFVIDGKFIICHKFHHANVISQTYITTASLPIRYEITDTAATSGSSTLKQICSTVISEGGFGLVGAQQGVGTPITAAKDLGEVAGVYVPVVTIRLKSQFPDAVAILTALSLVGITNNANYSWEIIYGGATAGGSGTWLSAAPNQSVEYKLDATSITGGRVLTAGYTQGSNQGSSTISLSKDSLFKFQLERDFLNGEYYEITLACASNVVGADVFGSIDWEEISL
jgi:hypothetical protein